jgi:predicted transcriptional regulator YdeE
VRAQAGHQEEQNLATGITPAEHVSTNSFVHFIAYAVKAATAFAPILRKIQILRH